MALLDYANLVAPEFAKAYSITAATKNMFINELVTKRRVIRTGAPKIIIRRVVGRHSDAMRVTGTRLSVPLEKVSTFDTVEADWPHMIQPIILPHPDKWRLGSKDEVKRWVDASVKAAAMSHNIEVMRRAFQGTCPNTDYYCIASFNGGDTNGTTLGLENGAVIFDTPANQVIGALTYLGAARAQDTTYGINNWYNQYQQHAGIGVNFMQAVAKVKAYADEHDNADELGAGISMGALSVDDWVSLGDELAMYPGGFGPALHYTVDDLEKGKAYPAIYVARGVKFFPSRWMTVSGVTEPCYLFNPNAIEVWVHQGQDGKVGRFINFEETMGLLADVAFVKYSLQFVVTSPTGIGGVSQ